MHTHMHVYACISHAWIRTRKNCARTAEYWTTPRSCDLRIRPRQQARALQYSHASYASFTDPTFAWWQHWGAPSTVVGVMHGALTVISLADKLALHTEYRPDTHAFTPHTVAPAVSWLPVHSLISCVFCVYRVCLPSYVYVCVCTYIYIIQCSSR